MGEGRNSREARIIPIVLIILNLIAVAITSLKKYNVDLEVIYKINEMDYINISTFLTLFVGILIITSIKIDISEEAKIVVNNKIHYLNYINIALLIVLLIVQAIMKDRIVLYAMINIEIEFLAVYLLTRKGYAEELRYMRGNYENTLKKDRPNLLWRINFWFTPYEKVKFSDRRKGVNNNFLIFLIIASIVLGESGIKESFILLFIFKMKDMLSIIETIIPLQVSTKGVVTDIEEKTIRRSNKIYYRIYVTDYENRREVIVDVDSYPLIASGAELTVVHGMFSKKALYIKEINLDIRS